MNTALQNPALADPLQLLAGPFTDQVATLLNGDVRSFVLADRARRHLWLSLLDMGGAAARSAIVRFGWCASTDDLIQWVEGRAMCLRPLLKRMPAQALKLGQYTALADRIRHRPRTGRVLSQLGQLDQRTVDVALALPNVVVEVGLIRMAGNARQAEALSQLFEIAMGLGRSDHGLAAALAAAPTWSAVEKIMEGAVLPETLLVAPCPEDPRIRPVATLSELRLLGSEFNNCLRSLRRMPFGHQKERAYFLWSGSERVIVAVAKDPVAAWRIDEARLADNEEPSHGTASEIVEAFKSVGIVARPDISELLMRL